MINKKYTWNHYLAQVVKIFIFLIFFLSAMSIFFLSYNNFSSETTAMSVKSVTEKEITIGCGNSGSAYVLNGFETKYSEGKLYVYAKGGLIKIPLFWLDNWKENTDGSYSRPNNFGDIKEVYFVDGEPDDQRLIWTNN